MSIENINEIDQNNEEEIIGVVDIDPLLANIHHNYENKPRTKQEKCFDILRFIGCVVIVVFLLSITGSVGYVVFTYNSGIELYTAFIILVIFTTIISIVLILMLIAGIIRYKQKQRQELASLNNDQNESEQTVFLH